MENFKTMFKNKTKQLALDIIRFTEKLPKSRTADIMDKANEVVAITVSTIKTARRNR